MAYNEDTRVKIPALLHLESIGYTYLSLKGLSFDDRTNILTTVFKESIAKINSNIENINYDLLLGDIAETLDNDDLGSSFYNRFFLSTGIKLIDFNDFQNNNFNVSYLKDYFQKKNTIAKFYFIVDRIDLMTKARDEFVVRGLEVNLVTLKEEFIKNIKTIGAISNNTRNNEINVVNIQRLVKMFLVTIYINIFTTCLSRMVIL